MSKKKLLIIEDNEDHLGMLKAYLELEGYEVRTVTNGREGLEAVWREIPDLIVADWQMPEMDGIEMVRCLRLNPKTASLPVIIVTGAKTSPTNIVDGLMTGVDAYIPKPFELEELSLAIKELFKMRLRGNTSPGPIQDQEE